MKTLMDLPSLMDLPILILMDLPKLKTYILVHLRDITNQLNLSAIQDNALLQIGEKVKHDRRINCLSPSTCANIRNLQLNNIPKRKQRRKRAEKGKIVRQNGINLDNLIKIRCIPQQNSRIGIKCFTGNSRSLNNKEIHVRNFILENAKDFGIVTEMWYKDDSWVMSDINTFGLKTQMINRKNGKSGGGLALVHRQ